MISEGEKSVINKNSHFGMIYIPVSGDKLKKSKSGLRVTQKPHRCKIPSMAKEKVKTPDFARRLRRAREALGMEHAKEFADSAGIKPQTYGNYERGTRFPDYEELNAFASAGMNLEYLILGIGPVLKIQKSEKAG